jgi:hypothetical protein
LIFWHASGEAGTCRHPQWVTTGASDLIALGGTG